MAPPRPLLCSLEGCEYTTPEGNPNWHMVFNLLNIHSQTAHIRITGHQAEAAAPVATPSRLEKQLSRPIFYLNSLEATWNYTWTLWDAYIGQNIATESVKLQQLQAACNKSLLQPVFDTGVYASLTTVDLLEKMKELAVVTFHKGAHLRSIDSSLQTKLKIIHSFWH